MTTSITRLTKLLLLERGAPGGPAKAGRWFLGIALCALALLAAAPASAPADPPASPPVHQVKGGGVFFLEAGAAQGGNLILRYSINAGVDGAGNAHGYISSTIDWVSVPPPGGHPDPFGT